MSVQSTQWAPSAAIATLMSRARSMRVLRQFMESRDITEVHTPVLSSSCATDVHLDSFELVTATQSLYLLTSPELPIKRLLCAGMGDCYQVGSAFRRGEYGAHHNPEFTLLEWYRIGFTALELAEEVVALIEEVDECRHQLTAQRYTYQDMFLVHTALDPLDTNQDEVNRCIRAHGLWETTQPDLPINEGLDLLFSTHIAPQLPKNQLTVVYHYPADQAALARLCEQDNRVAERFEVFWGGVELANGFHELSDAVQQRARFVQENQARAHGEKAPVPMDEQFLDALEHGGLPDCSGVALGIDRLLMQVLDKPSIADVICFSADRV